MEMLTKTQVKGLIELLGSSRIVNRPLLQRVYITNTEKGTKAWATDGYTAVELSLETKINHSLEVKLDTLKSWYKTANNRSHFDLLGLATISKDDYPDMTKVMFMNTNIHHEVVGLSSFALLDKIFGCEASLEDRGDRFILRFTKVGGVAIIMKSAK